MSDGQFTWHGLTLGADTAYRIDGVEGWLDMPDIGVNDEPRPIQDGDFPGLLTSRARYVTITGKCRTADVPALRNAIGPRQYESHLVGEWAATGELLASARLVRRALPIDRRYASGWFGYALQWRCSDPRLYDALEQSLFTTLPTPEAGRGYNKGYPYGYGAASAGGSMAVTNAGNVESYPVLRIIGPAVEPTVSNLTTDQLIDFGITLADGEVLTIDTQRGTVDLGGADRLYTRSTQSTPVEAFHLLPGTNSIQFRAQAVGAGLLNVVWRSAYL